MYKSKIPVIGLMSGTSYDGIDCSLIYSDGYSLERTEFNNILPYKKETRKKLENIFNRKSKLMKIRHLIAECEDLITKDHIEATKLLLDKIPFEVNLIGFHGQTIDHNPLQKISIQLGDGQLLANKTKIKVINNFRKSDINNGGQGAPLAPIYHKLLMRQLNLKLPSVIVNIGGVTNLSYWDGTELIGFDTGPGNYLIDNYMRKKFNIQFDTDGRLASKGYINNSIVNDYINKDYILQKWPKSLDISDLNSQSLEVEINKLNSYDALSTLTYFTVTCLKKGIELLPKKINNLLICGGGAHNVTLVKMIKKNLNAKVRTLNELNLPGDFIEAELIAFLAVRRLYNLPITFPSTTGVKSENVGGCIWNPK